MNVRQLLEALDSATIGEALESISIYTTNDAGNLVSVESAQIITQRDEITVHVLVLKR